MFCCKAYMLWLPFMRFWTLWLPEALNSHPCLCALVFIFVCMLNISACLFLLLRGLWCNDCSSSSWPRWGTNWRTAPHSRPDLMRSMGSCTLMAWSPFTHWMLCSAVSPGTKNPTHCCWRRGQSADGPYNLSASPCWLSNCVFSLPSLEELPWVNHWLLRDARHLTSMLLC